ncbi:hypothetical protein [Blastococcus sp. Marseille-P5729]|uniref:hypothetical protein n=1 Tax=Blastococcus sp. Marseille-P5729 TaxID=2086582 RepID=UPI000D108B13|nr:hypothetical protein [Blastococcus sp. Marseille-P5729]
MSNIAEPELDLGFATEPDELIPCEIRDHSLDDPPPCPRPAIVLLTALRCGCGEPTRYTAFACGPHADEIVGDIGVEFVVIRPIGGRR